MTISRSYIALFVALLGSCVLGAAGEFSSGLESVLNKPEGETPKATVIPQVCDIWGALCVGPVIEWDYSEGPNGPAHWGELSKEWSECSSGTQQSPIDIDEAQITLDNYVDHPAKIYYHPAHAIVRGDGTTLEVEWLAGIFHLHGYDYVLEKLVFHTPSEHTYSGERFPLEIQFYHTHPEQGVAINTIVFREGEQNEWLNQFTSGFSVEILGKSISLGTVTSDGVNGNDLDWSRYYRVSGSLTTPPCTQRPSVVWSLLKAPLTASKDQIKKVSAALLNKPNARPLQDLNGRIIRYPRGVDDINL